uniref:Uncharacterized protein n=1 Tax=Arundo donax TaxID=35708 RepID=A0A0A9GGR0_ARUDO
MKRRIKRCSSIIVSFWGYWFTIATVLASVSTKVEMEIYQIRKAPDY